MKNIKLAALKIGINVLAVIIIIKNYLKSNYESTLKRDNSINHTHAGRYVLHKKGWRERWGFHLSTSWRNGRLSQFDIFGGDLNHERKI